MQRALAFLGVVLAAVIVDWPAQGRENAALRSELEAATSALSASPGSTGLGSIVHSQMSMELGPGGVDSLRVSCPPRYRIVYGRFHSVSHDSEVFSDSFGSARTWYVGLDNSGSSELGSVTLVVACEPAGRAQAPSAPTEQAACRQAAQAVAERAGDDYP